MKTFEEFVETHLKAVRMIYSVTGEVQPFLIMVDKSGQPYHVYLENTEDNDMYDQILKISCGFALKYDLDFIIFTAEAWGIKRDDWKQGDVLPRDAEDKQTLVTVMIRSNEVNRLVIFAENNGKLELQSDDSSDFKTRFKTWFDLVQ